MEGHPLTDGKSKRLIAYHEIGHALIGTLVKDHDPVQKVTVIPRGQAKGLTWFSPDDDQMLVSRAQLKARIMGARALQLSQGAPPFIDIPVSAATSLDISMKELEDRVIPITIRRVLPNGDYQNIPLFDFKE